ncbi:MAG TPA: hypothetical protein VJS19_06530 [Candidatus Dormibacteraeota bacterium]|nr:hypothetical protein [Candidatus Dormibacteraeota bacterium]
MTPPDLQSIGIWLLIASAVVILFEGVLAAIWSLRLSRKARAMSELLAAQQVVINADLERLRANIVETGELWKPYRRLLRLLRHPLTIALMQSYARRAAGR